MTFQEADRLSFILGILTYIVWVVLGVLIEQKWMICIATIGPVLAAVFYTIYLFLLRRC